ncbi:MAG: serine/threonine protein kinase [Planctomycetaceae bacterium]
MPRSPSPDLTHWLLAHRICTHRDFRRCEARVRRLAADLPPFDSVWLDALVQLGRLTPFQARILESQPPEELVLGPCLLVAQCSPGPEAVTWRVRHSTTGATFAARLLAGPTADSEQTRARINQLIQKLLPQTPPGICGPTQLLETPRGPVLLSPWTDGPSLRELVVKIGRFPPAVVAAVGRQLLESLAHLEQCHVLHGDLRLDNLLLTRAGQVVLVEVGIRPILEPEPTVHARLNPDRFDGTAPERIGSTQPQTPRSELYALGCLLWQLLVGRPPFPAGDPVVKLAHHQSREVPDVRELAPETPPALALAIQSLACRDPARRCDSASTALRDWPRLPHESTAILQRFRREIDHRSTVPHRPRTHRRLSMAAWGTLGLALFAASALGWSSHGDRSWPEFGFPAPKQTAEQTPDESPASKVIQASHITTSEADPEPSAPPPRKPDRSRADPVASDTNPVPAQTTPLPEPDSRGRIQLSGGHTYTCRDLSVVGPLLLQCPDEQPATIRVSTPGELVAASIAMKNVVWDLTAVTELEHSDQAAALNLRTQRIDLTSVGFRGPRQPGSAGTFPPSLRWELVDERDLRSSRLRLDHCAFRDGGTAVVIPQPVGRLEFEQTLFEGNETAVEFAGSGRRIPPIVLQARHITTRDIGTMVRWWGDEGPPQGVRLELEFHDSVFHLRENDSAVCQVVSSRYTNDWISRLRIVGEGNLLVPGRTVVRWQSDQSAESLELESPDLVVEGLMAVPFEFAAAQGAALKQLAPSPGLAIRRTTPPGCDAGQIPD